MRLLITAAVITGAVIHSEARDGNFRQNLPSEWGTIRPYDADSVKNAMKERGMHRIEGIWRVTDGATIAIERDISQESRHSGSPVYRLVVIESPDRSIRPGTILGYATGTASPVKYDARLLTNYTGNLLSKVGIVSDRYTLTLTHGDSRIEFDRHKRGLRLDIRKTLPLVLRTTLRYESGDRKPTPAGCIRLYPFPALPDNPIYL